MVEGELKEMGITWKEAEKKARDRQIWGAADLSFIKLCANMHEEN